MDLDELQRRWQEQERTLQASLRLNARIVRELELQKVSSALGRLSRWIAIELAINIVPIVWLGSYLGDRIGVARFALPAAALLAGAIAIAGSSVEQLVRIASIDYGAPVLVIQKQLESLRLLQMRTMRWIVRLATLAWTPLLIVGLDALIGRHVDVYALLGARYLAANLLVGVAMIPLLAWMARRSIWRRLTKHLDDRNLAAARRFLASLAAFEAEAQAPR